jgi:hypothetical protein
MNVSMVSGGAAEEPEQEGQAVYTYRCDDWKILTGVRVQLRQAGAPVRVGCLEAATADSSALWLAAEGVERRTLYTASDGYEVWIDPEKLPDSVYTKLICHTPEPGEISSASDTTES